VRFSETAFQRLREAVEDGQRELSPEVTAMAEWHSVLPLLYSRRRGTDASASFMETIRPSLRLTAQKGMLLSSELVKITAAFEAAGVPVLAFKGPVLALTAYGDLAKRDFEDLDLVLRPEDLARARSLLEQNGWKPWQAFTQLSAAEERVYLQTGYHFQYSRPDGSVPVELHWNIAPHAFGIVLPMEQLFRRAVTVRIGAGGIPAPSAEDHLVLLCIHAARHMWDRLGLIVDVAQLLRAHPKFDFDQALRFASELHASRMVLLGLNLAHDVFGTSLPARVIAGINEDSPVGRLAAQVISNLPRCRSTEDFPVMAHRFYFAVRERTRDKVRYGYRLAFEPSLNDAKLLGKSGAAARAGGWLRPFRVAGAVMRHSMAGVFRRF
jgi:hypothetical protein